MRLELVTLLGKKIDQEVYGVTLPTADGEISVYADHEPLVTLAVPGAIAVRHKEQGTDDDLEYFAISGGIVEIGGNKMRVLVDEADHGDDIVEAESKAALERALKLRDSAKSQVELEEAHQLVDKHAVRLRVAGLRRHRRRQK